jgi:hypothetical protein
MTHAPGDLLALLVVAAALIFLLVVGARSVRKRLSASRAGSCGGCGCGSSKGEAAAGKAQPIELVDLKRKR